MRTKRPTASPNRSVWRCGIQIRTSTATTFLVVDPAVEPEDLQHAVERYWWPALQDDSISFDVSVIAADGVKHPPRPKKNPDLQPFIRAYEIATVPQDNRTPQAHRTVLQRIGEFKKPGTVGLVAETTAGPTPGRLKLKENGSVEHRSLVALLRKPRMVVEYYEAARRRRMCAVSSWPTSQLMPRSARPNPKPTTPGKPNPTTTATRRRQR